MNRAAVYSEHKTCSQGGSGLDGFHCIATGKWIIRKYRMENISLATGQQRPNTTDPLYSQTYPCDHLY